MQDKEPEYSIEQKLRNSRKQLMMLGLAYVNLGEFIHDLVNHIKRHGVLGARTLFQYRDRAVSQFNNRSLEGLPVGWQIDDEDEILMGALEMVKNFIDRIVMSDEECLNPSLTACVEINFPPSLKLPSQDENPEYSPEQLLRITRKNAAACGVAYVNLGEFIHDVARHIKQHGVADAQALYQCRERAILRTKDTEGQGLSLEDEADAVTGGLTLVKNCLDSIAVADK